MKRYFLHIILFTLLSACAANKKAATLWVSASTTDQSVAPEILPLAFELYRMDLGLLTNSLKGVGADEDEGIFVQLPDPDGNVNSFKVWRSSVVSEVLLEKYPNLRAYQGFSISDQSEIRMELPVQGLQVMVRSVGKTWFIAPYDKEQELYMTYYKSDYPSDNQFWEGRIK